MKINVIQWYTISKMGVMTVWKEDHVITSPGVGLEAGSISRSPPIAWSYGR